MNRLLTAWEQSVALQQNDRMRNRSEADEFGGFKDGLQDAWWSAVHYFLQPKLRLKQNLLLGYNLELLHLQLTPWIPTTSEKTNTRALPIFSAADLGPCFSFVYGTVKQFSELSYCKVLKLSF